jgi:hypothetical protein
MKLASLLVLVLAAACSHSDSKSKSTTASSSTTAASDDSAMVDPTLPSWAPPSCKRYHVVVVKAVDCPELDAETRTTIKNKYEAQNTAWHGMQNAELSAIDQVGTECETDMKSVQATTGGKCVTAAQR